jgi:hypothetical protein
MLLLGEREVDLSAACRLAQHRRGQEEGLINVRKE